MIAEVCRRVETASPSPAREQLPDVLPNTKIDNVDLSSLAAEPKVASVIHPRKYSSSTTADKPNGQRKGFGINLKPNGLGED